MGTYGSLCVLWVHMCPYRSFCVPIDFNGFLFVFNKSFLNAFFCHAVQTLVFFLQENWQAV